MNLSVKLITKNCLGISSPFSVLNKVFGFYIHPGRTLSLKKRLKLCQEYGFNINIILIGDDKFKFEDWKKIHYSIQFMRDIFSEVSLCVRKIRWQGISSTEAGGYMAMTSKTDPHKLTEDFSGPNGDYLDVFVARSMSCCAGKSAVKGPCSKDHKTKMTGAVVSLNGDDNYNGNTFAHEIGHYLGLKHNSEPGNFINGDDGASNSNTGINSTQGTIMKSHCYVKKVC